MRQFGLILLIITCLALLGQQDPHKDSLQQQLLVQKNDSNKVLTLIALGQHVENQNLDAAKHYYREALQLSQAVNYQTGVLKYYSNYTAALNMQARYDSSILLNKEAVVLAKNQGNLEYVAKAQYNLGTTYSLQGNDADAIQYMLEGAFFFEQRGDSGLLQIAYEGLGGMYRREKLYERSREYLEKAVRLASKPGMEYELAASRTNLAAVLADVGQTDSARQLLDQAFSYFSKARIPLMVLKVQVNIGHVLMKAREYRALYTRSQQTIQLARSLDQPADEMIGYLQRSLASLRIGLPDTAASAAEKGIILARQIGDTLRIVNFYEVKTAVAMWQRDPVAYDSLYAKMDQITDAMKSELVRRNIQLADQKYETTKKEQQILLQQSRLKQGRLERWLLAGGIMAIALIGFLLLRTASQKAKLQRQRITELEKEKQLLATQQLLRGQEEERNRFARDLHDGLGGMLSGIKLQLGAMKGNLIMSEDQAVSFNQALAKLDESIREMRRVAHNMTPESLIKFGLQHALEDYCEGMASSSGITVNAEFHGLEPRMDGSRETVIYRIVQELVNNAVKHARASQILVQVIRQDDHLNITVEDNGRGFDTASNSSGSGLSNIRSRVDYLNGKMDIKSSPGLGCSVYIECPSD